MSLIPVYVRTDQEALSVLSANPAVIFEDLSGLPSGTAVTDIGKAYDAMAWLASPLKREETLHSARLIRDRDWAMSDAPRENVVRLDAMVVDDALAAIEGRPGERLEGFDFGLGAAVVFRPERVRELAVAISGLDDGSLRASADFSLMDEHDVQPSGWLEDGEGEAILSTYILPALDRLKSFYAAAAQQNQTVLVVWT